MKQNNKKYLLVFFGGVLMSLAAILWVAGPVPVSAEEEAEEACCPDCGPEDKPAEKKEEKKHDDHDEDDHEDHDDDGEDEDNDHDDHAEKKEQDDDGLEDHAGHGHEEDEDGDEEDESLIHLTDQQKKRIGLKTEKAGPGTISVSAEFPGELLLNPDRMVHIVPSAGGIVRTVMKTLGDRVKEGEVLAVLESSELAEAKLDFYAKMAEVGCCLLELPRARAIFDNTSLVLKLIEKNADPEELEKLHNLEMGEYLGILTGPYTEYVAAAKNFDREHKLHGQGVTSDKELLESETEYRKAKAELQSTLSSVRYAVRLEFGEAAERRQVAEFEAVAAEKKLELLGVDQNTIDELKELVPKVAGMKPCTCTDPNCEDGKITSVMETLGKRKGLGWYALRAPIPGVITEKHISLGERLGDDEEVFTVADTSSIWVRFEIYQKDLAMIRTGQKAKVNLGRGMPEASGVIVYISPVLDKETRTASARIVLENKKGLFRPGLYASVDVATGSRKAAVVVPRGAVQVLDEEHVVFIKEGDGFGAVVVKLGFSDSRRAVILKGLEPGQVYVTRGAFELKAEVVTSGLDPHAGHGH